MGAAVDWSLYLVTDRGLSRGRSDEAIVRAAVAGGVTVVQYRDKDAPARAMVEACRALQELLAASGGRARIPLIVNDRLDVALAVGADGVHLGQSDLPARDARRLLGPDRLLGVSVEHPDQVDAAVAAGADYLGVSPIWTTPTKPELETGLGLDGLAAIRRRTTLPLVAIGGIGADNAGAVIAAGADGVAVVSAIVAADDPRAAASALRAAVARGRGGRAGEGT